MNGEPTSATCRARVSVPQAREESPSLEGGEDVNQRTTQRATERAEERRASAATAEARRAEQLQAIKEFIACAQDAERDCYRRPDPWGADEEGWMTRAQTTMTRLWTAERTVMLLCDSGLHTPIHDFGRALNQAMWREIGEIEVNEHLEEHKAAFMTAARTSLGSG